MDKARITYRFSGGAAEERRFAEKHGEAPLRDGDGRGEPQADESMLAETRVYRFGERLREYDMQRREPEPARREAEPAEGPAKDRRGEEGPRRRKDAEERPSRFGTSNVIPLERDEFRIVDERPTEWTSPSEFTYTHDYGAWKSPIDEETERIERLIRESGRESGSAASETTAPSIRFGAGEPPADRDERYPAVEPETGYFSTGVSYAEPLPDGPSVTGPRYVRHSPQRWWKLALAVAGAGLTGVFLGFFILSLFSDWNVSPPPETVRQGPGLAGGAVVPDGADADAEKPAGGQGDAQNAAATPAAGDSAASGTPVQPADIPARTYILLQNGTFSTAAAAETAKADLAAGGFAAWTEAADRYFVYAGIAPNRNDAEALKQSLETGGFEVYAKTYELPATDRISWNGEPARLEDHLSRGHQLVGMLSGMTLLHLSEEEPAPFAEASLQSFRQTFDVWSAEADAVREGAPQAAANVLQRMNEAMTGAKQAIDRYQQTPSRSGLLQVQTHLMAYVVAERELLNMVKR